MCRPGLGEVDALASFVLDRSPRSVLVLGGVVRASGEAGVLMAGPARSRLDHSRLESQVAVSPIMADEGRASSSVSGAWHQAGRG